MNKPKLNERVLPVKYTGRVNVDWFRKFTLAERLKILVGYNLVVGLRLVTQHTPGKFQPIVAAQTTKITTPTDQMKMRLENEMDVLMNEEEKK